MIFWIPKTVLLMQKALLIWSGQCFHKIIHMLHFHWENYHLFSFLEMIICIEKLSRHHFSEYLLPASEVMMNVQCTPQKGAQQKETWQHVSLICATLANQKNGIRCARNWGLALHTDLFISTCSIYSGILQQLKGCIFLVVLLLQQLKGYVFLVVLLFPTGIWAKAIIC